MFVLNYVLDHSRSNSHIREFFFIFVLVALLYWPLEKKSPLRRVFSPVRTSKSPSKGFLHRESDVYCVDNFKRGKGGEVPLLCCCSCLLCERDAVFFSGISSATAYLLYFSDTHLFDLPHERRPLRQIMSFIGMQHKIIKKTIFIELRKFAECVVEKGITHSTVWR